MSNFPITLIPITLFALWLTLALAQVAAYVAKGKLPSAATWTVLIFALLCGLFALFFGWLGYDEATKKEFYVNLSTSLGSIAVTVLFIDQLSRWRIASERKREIIEQLGSDVLNAASEAVRLAWKNGWARDGSLEGAILARANLQGAHHRRIPLPGIFQPVSPK